MALTAFSFPLAAISIGTAAFFSSFGAHALATAAEPLRFVAREDGSFAFDTKVLKGVLRQEGQSSGLVSVTAYGSALSGGNSGLFNHYRVFTRGTRYGDGARSWPSSAELRPDGSVEVVWPEAPDRPFALHATYRLVAANAIDLVTTVYARQKLEAFEVWLASYFGPTFGDSRVWASRDPRGGATAGFVSAEPELGDWLAFPRDERAVAVIEDGRWTLGRSPLTWSMMPSYARPLAIRRDAGTGITGVVLGRHRDCFGVFTPHRERRHMSNYLSLFGHDIEAGESASARSRLVVLSDPTEEEILAIADAFLAASP
jgi:hypothetical protein